MDAFIPELQKLQKTVDGKEATAAMFKNGTKTPQYHHEKKKKVSFKFLEFQNFCVPQEKQEDVEFQFQTEL